MSHFSHVTCPFCGCLCDDLKVQIEQDQILRLENACPRAQASFNRLQSNPPPAARIQGIPAPLQEGLKLAAQILRSSRAPLIFGLGPCSTEDHRAVIDLADWMGGSIHTSGSPLTQATTMAIQQTGISTCTLGEIRQRADLAIFWGADPMTTHPRFLERFLHNSSKEFLPHGRSDRHLVCIGSTPTRTEEHADGVIRIPAESDFAIISVLRQLFRTPEWQPDRPTELPVKELKHLVKQMRECRYGTILFGPGLTQTPVANLVLQSLFGLVADLNQETRFTARGLSDPGAENALTWQSGYPLGVNFSQGYPLYQPKEFSANEILSQHATDCCLVIGTDCLQHLTSDAFQSLEQTNRVIINPPHMTSPLETQEAVSVELTSSLPGVHTAGTMYRMDDIALPVQKLYDSPFPSVAQLIHQLRSQIDAQ